jgi:hypothetical protein
MGIFLMSKKILIWNESQLKFFVRNQLHT